MSTATMPTLETIHQSLGQIEQNVHTEMKTLVDIGQFLLQKGRMYTEMGNALSGFSSSSPNPVKTPVISESNEDHDPGPRRNARRAAPKASARKDEQKKYSVNSTSLRETIFEVLSNPKEWRKHIKDIPDGAEGLRPSEIKTIIESEGKWSSDSPNVSAQIQTHLGSFRTKGIVIRAEGKRYCLVDGAKLD